MTQTHTPSEPSRWVVLALLGVAQLMVVLDLTVVSIALPSAQKALHFSSDNRQWIVTAYALAFGSLLLLGGKLGDLFGRKWTFIAGLTGFSLASALGGLAQSFAMLVAARALQGVFGALLAPSALGLLTTTFADSPDRPKAFGIFGAIAGGGASVGLLLGGALTQALSWRWCLYVNLAIAVPTAILSLRLLVNHAQTNRPHIDLPGVVTGSAGLFAVVYGFSNAETHSWSDPVTVIALAASAVLLCLFVAIERRRAHPLLPLHIVANRARGGAYASIVLGGAGVLGAFLFLTYFMQQNLGFSPLSTGLAFLPMTALVVLSSTISQTRILPRTGAKPLITVGMLLGVVAMVLLTRLSPSSGYAAGRSAVADGPRPGPGPDLRAGDRHRHARRRPHRGGRRLGDGQHLPANRRLGGHRAAQHPVRQLGQRLRAHPHGPAGPPGRRPGPRVHHGVLVVRRDLRRRAADRGGRIPDAHHADGAGTGRRVRRHGRAGSRRRVDAAAAIVRPAQPVELPA